MKQKLLKTMRLLLVAILLGVGANDVWAYDLPKGFAINKVIFGNAVQTAGVTTSVTVEDFSDAESISGWTCDDNASVAVGNVTFVDKIAEGSVYENEPTYVNGKCIELSTKNPKDDKTTLYATYNFEAITRGYLVFNCDTWRSGTGNKNHPQEIRFIDSEGNPVLYMHYNNGANGNWGQPFKIYASDGSELSSGRNSYMRSYTGFGIQDLIINLNTGACSMTLDYTGVKDVDGTKYMVHSTASVSFNIGIGHNIAGIMFGRHNENGTNVTCKTYFDNLTLYQVVPSVFSEDYEEDGIVAIETWTTKTDGRFTPIILTENTNHYLSVQQGERNNNGTTLTGTTVEGKRLPGDDFTMTFQLKLGSSNNQSPVSFTIKDAANTDALFSLTAKGTYSTTWKVNGSETIEVELPGTDSQNNKTPSDDNIGNLTWYTVKLTLIGSKEYITISNTNTGAVMLDHQEFDSQSANGGLGKMTFVTQRQMANFAMDNVLIRDVAVGDLVLDTAPTISTADSKSYFSSTQTVTLACETDDANIRYTTDGSTPTSSSTLYSAPFDISATTTVKAIAIKGYALSDVVSATISKLYTQTTVTEAETWDWSVITSGSAQLTDATTPKKNEYFVLKNLELYDGYSIPADFGDAQKLNVRGEYGFRIVSGTKFFQGAYIKFTTEVPGTIEVQFSNTGNNDERHLTVNGIEKGDGTSSTDKVTASDIPVATGEVVLGASTNYLRFYKIVFTPNLEVANAIADCKANETSAEFATYIDGNAYATAAEVYAAHTAWQIENGTPSKAILNNTVTSADHFWGTLTEGANYTGAPDTKYLANTEGADYNVNQIVYQLPAGVYRASAWTYSSVTGWRKIYVSKVPAGGDWEDLITPYTSTEGWVELSGEFSLTEPANIAFGMYASEVSGRVAGFDNWNLTKIGTKLNASGYSTFSSSLNLQLTGADAYTATLDLEKEKITCTKIDDGKIPAGTGVLLYGENNAEVTFTVIESAPALSNNDLKATTLANGSLAAKGENTYYVLSGNTFMQYTGAAFAAGKAYFEVNGDAVQARKFTIVFDNESTGIQTIDNSQFTTDNYYNLKGQRVTQPTKGLYIVNGKKVLVNDKR